MKALLLMALTGLTAAAQTPAQKLADRFFDEYLLPTNPTTATYMGVHKYDGDFEDYSKAALAKRLAELKKFEAEFAKLPSDADRDMMLGTIRSAILDFEHIKTFEKNPDVYSSSLASSAFTIMSRTFAPPDVRLRSLISREKKMPVALTAARQNLVNPPKIFTEVAIEQIPGIIRFFQSDVPLAFKSVTDTKLQADFNAANGAVISALQDYEKFLKSELLAKSNGDFKIGADNYAKKVLYDEMVDVPLDRLLGIGYADLRANQKRLRETAALIDKNNTPQQIIADLEKDHPAADRLLDTYRQETSRAREFVISHKLATIASPVLPILQETPPFARALTFASMDTPGPYETVAREAYFNVTLPEKTWKPERVEDFLRGHHQGTIVSTAIHEAYPGHYTQLLWSQKLDSRIRKMVWANSNIEGWAHYCEQMMFDEGYSNDPKLRLGQIQDALMRDARYIVGIELHTGKKTFEQGVDFFVKEGYQTHETGMRETKRGTSDPTYLYYTLGKLQILKLREDYKKLKGAKFSPQEFHDSFMKQGYPPIKIVRKALLGNDSPTL